MRLTVLGSGTLFPTKKRFPSAYLLEAGGEKYLLDCGHCAIARLTELGVDIKEIKTVFLSHFHADHAADAFPLVHARAVAYGQEGNETEKMDIIGPSGTRNNWKAWTDIYWPSENDYPVDIYEDGKPGKVRGLEYSCIRTTHHEILNSVAYRLESAGKSLVYTGDISQNQDLSALAGFAANVDLLVIDAGGAGDRKGHLTLGQVAEVAESAQAEKVLLTHLLSHPEEEARIQDFTKSRKGFIIAKDKMVLTI